MSYKILDQKGNPIKRKGSDGKEHDSLGSAKGGVLKGVDRDRRTLTMIGTDESTDRDGDNILTSGWMLDNFLKNPVFLWGHNYSLAALAAATKVMRKRSPWRMEFVERFLKEGIHTFADMVFELFDGKVMNASSVGFIPYEWDEKTEEEVRNEGLHPFVYRPKKFKKQELLELSAVSVPSNPNAVQVRSDEDEERFVAEFSDDFEKMEAFILSKGFKDFETDPLQVLRFKEPLVLAPAVQERVDNEIGEMIHKGVEFEDELEEKLHQVPAVIDKNNDGEESGNASDVSVDGKDTVTIDSIREVDPEIADELIRLYGEGLIGVVFDIVTPVEDRVLALDKILPQLKTLADCISDSIKLLEESDLDSSVHESDETSFEQESEEDKFGSMLWGKEAPASVLPEKAACQKTDQGDLVTLVSKVADLANVVGKLDRIRQSR